MGVWVVASESASWVLAFHAGEIERDIEIEREREIERGIERGREQQPAASSSKQ